MFKRKFWLSGLFGSLVIPCPAQDVPGSNMVNMVLVPAGPFTMGSDLTDQSAVAKDFGLKKPLYMDEHPKHTVTLPAYWIDKFEVTNAEYLRFVIATNGWVPVTWEQTGYLLAPHLLAKADSELLRRIAIETFKIESNVEDLDKDALISTINSKRQSMDPLPVTGVTWKNANDYCHWLGKRLPTEAQWEKAARGVDQREYPWGVNWDETKLNAGGGEKWEYGVAPVGSYPAGESPFKAHDLAGNVMEWVHDWYAPYPGSNYQSENFGKRFRVARGGGWGGTGHYAVSHFYRNGFRFFLDPEAAFSDLGFRCVASEQG